MQYLKESKEFEMALDDLPRSVRKFFGEYPKVSKRTGALHFEIDEKFEIENDDFDTLDSLVHKDEIEVRFVHSFWIPGPESFVEGVQEVKTYCEFYIGDKEVLLSDLTTKDSNALEQKIVKSIGYEDCVEKVLGLYNSILK